ncbi:helix-turn-helix transcriptional regulator [uncultured Streptomyces sp.]|uniref:helix-turn-helix transcriptional regulator n=1 Tax=uncultured Streptomyces sp. TaxID=174707 RepID=UPI00260EE83C|nr:helix-turn-helix transcriptional regulator [uncultured Streptomyces sp.]
MCRPGWGRARAAAQRLAEFARLRRVRDRLDREYALPLDMEALAREAGMPAGLLGRRFREAYGISPYAYLTARRVRLAVVLLGHGTAGPAELHRLVGCPSASVLRTRFTEAVGVAPEAYRPG